MFRGLAILLMVPANFAPYLAEPHPTWYRVLGSLAAPMFISLSAGMVALQRGKHSLGYYAKRGGCVVLIGAMIDWLLSGILPFTSFDVLYVIGLSLPLAYLVREWPVARLCLAATAVFLAAVWLQLHFGYHSSPYQIYLTDLQWPDPARWLQSLLVDGWFPLFPWIGFALLGVALFRIAMAEGADFALRRRVAPVGSLLVAAGAMLLFVQIPGIRNLPSGDVLESRHGYSDIFYPATAGYLAVAAGSVLVMAGALHRVSRQPATELLAYLGQYSMLIYVLHTVWAAAVLRGTLDLYELDEISSGFTFAAVTVASLAIFLLTCRVIERLKAIYPPKSLALQIMIGK